MAKRKKPTGIRKVQRYYTLSTRTFKTLEAAKKQILKYEESGGYNKQTKIYEVLGVYEVEIKKVVVTKKEKPKAEEDPLTLY